MKIIIISQPALITPETKDSLKKQAEELGTDCEFILENSEGGLITAIQRVSGTDSVILNAGDFASYSIAIRDAISSIEKTPVVEVHLSNTPADGTTGRASVLSAVCDGVISGFGQYGYAIALQALTYEKRKRIV